MEKEARKTIVIEPDLPMRVNAPPRGFGAAWFFRGERLDGESGRHAKHPWHRVLWLTGVDYFSTLGYQPGIALLAAGALSPVATGILVVVTLLGALPVYAQVARRSYAGQGSIAMLENLLRGWKSKLFVLVLIGFAATDFVITMTLSAADAAQHAVENPILKPYLGHGQFLLTVGLLALLAGVFLRGFREAIGVAQAVAVPYILLNFVVLGRGLFEILRNPEALSRWRNALTLHGDWTAIALVSLLTFPKLALGLSGFETGVAVMPLIGGGRPEPEDGPPEGRIRATRRLLLSAALLMSVLLVLSSFVTAVLIPEEAYRLGGPAAGRALAYLAHGLLGETFGSVYDFVTILILWFAGASAMAGLLNLIPRYLPRFGMAPRWVVYSRPLVLILFAADLIVTAVFRANVEAQGGAYATGVLALMLSAAVAVALALWREAVAGKMILSKLTALSFYFWGVVGVFAFTLGDNVVERPDGVIIASCFIAAVVALSLASRTLRSVEMRAARITFRDEESLDLWNRIKGKRVHLVPMRTRGKEARRRKHAELKKYYAVKGPVAFVHVGQLDNRSEFASSLALRIRGEEDNYVIEVSGAIAIANTIAFISELIDPISIFLGLTRQNLVQQALRYLFFGEGETGLMVYTILLSYWEWTPEEDIRPLIFLMSE